ncbi:hypothetical protein SmJEL517_g00705 [Synchytrium microbalum]|uniref:E2F/DP family winged-helix DNA-binding domain-containing protein n=1 Tax=Synchytrium microbalum TaxID=1806994 RepID=A0A507CHH2_9FUNG|nr:uncharacterized protein SmJEL517_g00705 [Synchytrium microbalum]TPX37484.1 hypothetical protein SmJEL517_g00705 [Synchytrium microbalum]
MLGPELSNHTIDNSLRNQETRYNTLPFDGQTGLTDFNSASAGGLVGGGRKTMNSGSSAYDMMYYSGFPMNSKTTSHQHQMSESHPHLSIESSHVSSNDTSSAGSPLTVNHPWNPATSIDMMGGGLYMSHQPAQSPMIHQDQHDAEMDDRDAPPVVGREFEEEEDEEEQNEADESDDDYKPEKPERPAKRQRRSVARQSSLPFIPQSTQQPLESILSLAAAAQVIQNQPMSSSTPPPLLLLSPIATAPKPAAPVSTPPVKKPFVPSAVSDDDPLKNIKGLRHFSKMVADKVEAKGETTYNEVADELVVDFTAQVAQYGGRFDQKNIRRRVYDALNVLMAMDIIEKDKKYIRWIGMPLDGKPGVEGDAARPPADKLDLEALKRREAELKFLIDRERREMQEKLLKESRLRQLAYQNEQIERERQRERERYSAEGITDYPPDSHDQRIFLPFVLVQSPKTTNITIEEGPEKSEYMFTFSEPFTLHEDNDVVGHIGGFISPLNHPIPNVSPPNVSQAQQQQQQQIGMRIAPSGSVSTGSPSSFPSPAPVSMGLPGTYQQIGGLVGYSMPQDYSYDPAYESTVKSTDAFAASLATRLTSESQKSVRQRFNTGGSTDATPVSSVPASPRQMLPSMMMQNHLPLPNHYTSSEQANHQYAVPYPQNPSRWMMGYPAHAASHSNNTSATGSGTGTPPSLSRVASPHLFAPTYAYGAHYN